MVLVLHGSLFINATTISDNIKVGYILGFFVFYGVCLTLIRQFFFSIMSALFSRFLCDTKLGRWIDDGVVQVEEKRHLDINFVGYGTFYQYAIENQNQFYLNMYYYWKKQKYKKIKLFNNIDSFVLLMFVDYFSGHYSMLQRFVYSITKSEPSSIMQYVFSFSLSLLFVLVLLFFIKIFCWSKRAGYSYIFCPGHPTNESKKKNRFDRLCGI
jgi:hypothetical protein